MKQKVSAITYMNFGLLEVRIFDNRLNLGLDAAKLVATALINAVTKRGHARVIFASAPSQNEMIDALIANKNIPWPQITAFHMDEYLDIDPMRYPSFGHYLREKLFSKVPIGQVHYINPDSNLINETIQSYSDLLHEAPIDVVCLGIGENGHLAFNDPPVADFNDPFTLKVIELDAFSLRQQVNDAGFKSIDDVPKKALTLTIPALLSAHHKIISVPGSRKAKAVYDTLKGPVATTCPASILRESGGVLCIDTDAAIFI